MASIKVKTKLKTKNSATIKIDIKNATESEMDKLWLLSNFDLEGVDSVENLANYLGNIKSNKKSEVVYYPRLVYKTFPAFFNFSQCGLSAGDVLTYVCDPTITATVSESGAHINPSRDPRGKDLHWGDLDRWTYKGKSLLELRLKGLGYFWDDMREMPFVAIAEPFSEKHTAPINQVIRTGSFKRNKDGGMVYTAPKGKKSPYNGKVFAPPRTCIKYVNAPGFNFEQCGVAPLSVLTLSSDPGTIVIVKDKKYVYFKGQKMPLTKATVLLRGKKHETTEKWLYEGESLNTRRKARLGYFCDPDTKKIVVASETVL